MAEPAKIGDLASVFVGRLAPVHKRCSSVAQAWDSVLPSSLRAHCRVAGLSGGRLNVVVDASSYMYELQLCSAELLDELRRLCPSARLDRLQVSMTRD